MRNYQISIDNEIDLDCDAIIHLSKGGFSSKWERIVTMAQENHGFREDEGEKIEDSNSFLKQFLLNRRFLSH